MVTHIFVQNNSSFRLAVKLHTRSLDPSWPELTGKIVEAQASEVLPQDRAVVALIHRSKVPVHEKHEVLTDLTILDADGNPTAVSAVLKQKVHGKLIGSSLQISLSANPYELLSPEQPWGKSRKTYEGQLSLHAGALAISYRFLNVATGDGDVEYSFKQTGDNELAVIATTAEEAANPAVVATADDANANAQPGDLVLETVYENQRGSGMSGPKSFSSKALFPGTERGQWSNTHGQHRLPKEYIDLPNNSWKWLWDWKVDMNGDLDEDGWQYAFSWRSSHWVGKCSATTFVRRRRWIRMRRKIEEEESHTAPNARRRNVTLDEVTNTEDLDQRVHDFHLMDAERTELIRAFLLSGHMLTTDELVRVFGAYQFEIGRVEAIKTLCPECITREQVQQELLPLIKFFSYKRQLVHDLSLAQ